jgi:hypothetical protein
MYIMSNQGFFMYLWMQNRSKGEDHDRFQGNALCHGSHREIQD